LYPTQIRDFEMEKVFWKLVIITFVVGICTGCHNRQPQTISEKELPLEEKNEVEELSLEVSGDTSFTDFLDEFMWNKEKKKSRIVFPFKKGNKTIQTPKDWKHLPFYTASDYIPILSSDTLTLYNKAINASKIELSIIDFKKKIADKYSFEKINNKWFLLSSGSSSINNVTDFEFIDFLSKFSEDTAFQTNHILFPLPTSLIDYDGEDYPIISKTILLEEWKQLQWGVINQLMVLSNIDSNNKYRNLHFRGVENGIGVEYTFEKINGNWKMIRFEDYSM
jgi:hypothetical protein